MSDKKALVPVAQRAVDFYGDEIQGVVISTTPYSRDVYVPVRPICDYLGVNWSSQRQRINRDLVLKEAITSVYVGTSGGPQDMLCLPLDYLNGWLFGINASRVKEEMREKVVQYQRECYRVLAEAFIGRGLTDNDSPTVASLFQVREMGRAIMQMADEQIEIERRLTTTEDQVGQAAIVINSIDKRVSSLEKKLSPGQAVTEEQASQISQAVKAVAMKLSEVSGRNEYGGVYGELYRRYGITSYKLLPAAKFEPAMSWMSEWYQQIADTEVPF
jgi:hypothetical protein